MKALILVGGFGTRLRPFTFTKAKPLVEFCNLQGQIVSFTSRPIVFHQLRALSEIGVKQVILAVSYMPQQMYGIDIIISVEDIPMGTAGPIALARKYLEDEDVFFVFNSDVSCTYPLKKLLEFHKKHGKEGTIAVTTVTDPSKYGVVVADETGLIDRFVEKPKEYVGNHINAGIYVFTPSILKRIPSKPTSIERDIFPIMAKDKELYSIVLDGFWMDIGQPKDFVAGTALYLDFIRQTKEEVNDSKFATGEGFQGNVLLHSSAQIGAGCTIGPNVVIGEGVRVGDHCVIQNSTIMSRSVIDEDCVIEESIVGWHNHVNKGARLLRTYTGDDVTVKSNVSLEDYHIAPNKK
ncbi:hypothetical protein WA556_003011 [Blastocystis sp. ATCC 50177/Nand II]